LRGRDTQAYLEKPLFFKGGKERREEGKQEGREGGRKGRKGGREESRKEGREEGREGRASPPSLLFLQ
jgi:hypothetical protein